MICNLSFENIANITGGTSAVGVIIASAVNPRKIILDVLFALGVLESQEAARKSWYEILPSYECV